MADEGGSLASEAQLHPPARAPTVSEVSSDLEELLKVLITPMPVPRSTNPCLHDQLVRVGRAYYLDPMLTLKSVMRALHVVTAVLRDNGHVYVVGGHPGIRPLVSEAARCCSNPNVWFHAEQWAPGTLTEHRADSRLFKPQHQPNKRAFAKAGR